MVTVIEHHESHRATLVLAMPFSDVSKAHLVG
jgi:hypothetical protein